MVTGMSYGKKLALVVLSASFGMLGCTTTSKNVPVRYVPPTQYQAYNCKQLAVEFQRKQTRIEEIAVQLDEKASKDQLVGAFGAVVFFPVLFMLGGNPLLEDEYAGLVGEAEAMQQAAFQKKCATIGANGPSAGLR
jgi:hypothetical protein